MSSPGNIVIKLEIQIPTSCGTPSVVLTSPQALDPKPLFLFEPLATCPSNLIVQTVPVRLPAGSGSGSTGTICGWAQFGDATPSYVQAQAILKNDATLKALGSSPPGPPYSANGTPNSNNTFWAWNGYLGQSEIPGAIAGTMNYLVIWASGDGVTWDKTAVPFMGQIGTSDPCGAPGGTICASGSGATAMGPPRTRIAASLHPAIWCVAVSGFVAAPLAVFNATWALRQVSGAAHPTWDNAADGRSAPSIQLKLCPKNGWMLDLRFQDNHAAYVLPFVGNSFGPLSFPARSEPLAGGGSLVLPAILVSGM